MMLNRINKKKKIIKLARKHHRGLREYDFFSRKTWGVKRKKNKPEKHLEMVLGRILKPWDSLKPFSALNEAYKTQGLFL